MQKGGGWGNFHSNDFGGGGGGPRGSMEIKVPRYAVGVVIGKGGEMIKKIQQETGARVQFNPDDGQSTDRSCSITGSPDQQQKAAARCQELIQNANVSHLY